MAEDIATSPPAIIRHSFLYKTFKRFSLSDKLMLHITNVITSLHVKVEYIEIGYESTEVYKGRWMEIHLAKMHLGKIPLEDTRIHRHVYNVYGNNYGLTVFAINTFLVFKVARIEVLEQLLERTIAFVSVVYDNISLWDEFGTHTVNNFCGNNYGQIGFATNTFLVSSKDFWLAIKLLERLLERSILFVFLFYLNISFCSDYWKSLVAISSNTHSIYILLYNILYFCHGIFKCFSMKTSFRNLTRQWSQGVISVSNEQQKWLYTHKTMTDIGKAKQNQNNQFLFFSLSHR